MPPYASSSDHAVLVRVPAGLSGPDVTALRRLLLSEVRRPGTEHVMLDLSATTAARRLAPLVAEVLSAADQAGTLVSVDPPHHPAARREFDRRAARAAPQRRGSDDRWSL
jgi:hypothetical protein